jgi:hypothetical protein
VRVVAHPQRSDRDTPAAPGSGSPVGLRGAFVSGELKKCLHRGLPRFKLDDVDGRRRCAEREHRVHLCGSAYDDNPAIGPPSPNGGGHDHMHAARVNQRQPSDVEHYQPGVTIGPAQRAGKLRSARGTKLADQMHLGDLAAAVLRRADKRLRPAWNPVATSEL